MFFSCKKTCLVLTPLSLRLHLESGESTLRYSFHTVRATSYLIFLSHPGPTGGTLVGYPWWGDDFFSGHVSCCCICLHATLFLKEPWPSDDFLHHTPMLAFELPLDLTMSGRRHALPGKLSRFFMVRKKIKGLVFPLFRREL